MTGVTRPSDPAACRGARPRRSVVLTGKGAVDTTPNLVGPSRRCVPIRGAVEASEKVGGELGAVSRGELERVVKYLGPRHPSNHATNVALLRSSASEILLARNQTLLLVALRGVQVDHKKSPPRKIHASPGSQPRSASQWIGSISSSSTTGSSSGGSDAAHSWIPCSASERARRARVKSSNCGDWLAASSRCTWR